MPKAAKKYYAVAVGRGGPKIYGNWDECKEKVSRYPGAVHKSFPSLTLAEEWLASKQDLHGAKHNPSPPVQTSESQAVTILSQTSSSASNEAEESEGPSLLSPPQIVLLSPEQRLVLDRVKHGRSVFFTGSAGTGKSVLLREIIRTLEGPSLQLAITASTGIAAVNIGGCTLHSWAGIGLGEEPADRYIGKFFGQPKCYSIRERWERVKTLIIDEISMIDGVLFDKLEAIARGMRKSNLPFGGIQLILSGDFCQLPPVPGRNPRGQQIASLFAFDAESWNDCVGSPVTLTRVFRQKDQAFVDMLNAMRFGEMNSKTVSAFTGLTRKVTYSDGIEPTELYPTRYEVENANSARLMQLNTESHTYVASEYPGIDSNGHRIDLYKMGRLLERLVVPKSIQLKVGAQVMLVKNLIQGELVNGSVGQVVRFSTAKEALNEHMHIAGIEKNEKGEKSVPSSDWAWPVVRFISGRETMCIPQEFTVNNASGQMEARRDQVPLILAWALSVHKSQGQTLERVKVDLRRTFEKGQAYVALSRATSLAQLQVLNFDPSKVVAHPRVLEWHGKQVPRQNEVIELFDSDDEMDNEEAMTAYYDA
ncbi:ATP-dependent DNA helicase PIF1 [Hypsizygus marmoreus]|uniref:ATP-dependent DNA helicase PIF1 n=1 Tax=Hypsizygus marmoreus TaxID=39966 RepID=A0A369K4X4_HYPMA|nr:ATP-dependent DNA helicase PIF1 [Hypsizygus marmoreus]